MGVEGEGGEWHSKLVLAAYTNLNGKIHGVDMPTAKLNSGEVGRGGEGSRGEAGRKGIEKKGRGGER